MDEVDFRGILDASDGVFGGEVDVKLGELVLHVGAVGGESVSSCVGGVPVETWDRRDYR